MTKKKTKDKKEKKGRGRPVKYTFEYCKKEVEDIYNKIMSDNNIVLLQDAIRDKHYSRQRFYEWRTNEKFLKDAIFSDTVKKIEDELVARMVKAGLLNIFNPTMTIFILKAVYGMKEVTTVETKKEVVLRVEKDEDISLIDEI